MANEHATVITIPFTNKDGEVVNRAQFSLAEAEQLTGVPVSQFRRMGRRGDINPITSFGRKWYIPAEDIVALLNKRMRNKRVAA
ncbi:MAG: hypothetical protein JWR26_271 [Pedosphaera sp.]|nr:hypothetical protein [Pedosphaera sp.]